MAPAHNKTEYEQAPPQWREAFVNDTSRYRNGEQCPRNEAIWAAVNQESGATAIGAIAEHMALCGACAEAWRIAVALHESVDETFPENSSGLWQWLFRLIPPIPAWAPALAGGLVIVLGIIVWEREPAVPSPNPDTQQVMRGANSVVIDAVTPDGVALSTDQLTLEWRVNEASKVIGYDVVMLDASLALIASASSLKKGEWIVSKELLDGLVEGDLIYWQVTAHLSDGREIKSKTYTMIVAE